MKFWVLPVVLIAVAGCTSREAAVPSNAGTQPPANAQIELKESLSASDFEAALVGTWESVFAYKSKQNIQSLTFRRDGTARIVTTHDGNPEQHSGSYTITFDREPTPDVVTFATITLKPNDSNPIILYRVNFGLHSGVQMKEGLLLRIDTEPHGVLKRRN